MAKLVFGLQQSLDGYVDHMELGPPDAEDHEFASAWRSRPKWVMSRSLKSVGPDATLVEGDIGPGRWNYQDRTWQEA
jgi:hypothetical protein